MHVMLDLETFGTRPGCALRSIGAVAFDLGTRVNEARPFYRNIDLETCLSLGLHIEAGTLLWWEDQSPEARAGLKITPRPLPEVVGAFRDWFKKVEGECVWAQGANFDPPLWEAACRACGEATPWKFYNARDTRTAYALAGFDPRSIKRAGTYHNALDDAKHQVACVQAAMRMMRGSP